MVLSTNGYLDYNPTPGYGAPASFAPPTDPQPGVWHTLAVSRSASAVALYLDGVLQSSLSGLQTLSTLYSAATSG